jgi:hypothetical protein
LLSLAGAPAAWALGKGSSILAVEFTDGAADLADFGALAPAGYLVTHRVSEVGIQAQYWRLTSDDYAFTFSLGYALSSEIAEPGSAATPPAGDRTIDTRSFNVRVGGDRVVRVGVRAIMYGGPGVEFWTGKGEYETGTSLIEGEATQRIGLSARIGAIMLLNEGWGLIAHLGHRFGYATAEQDGAKTRWWPSSFEGTMGVSHQFGGTP